MEERKAQQDNRFLKGRQIAENIYDLFKITGASEALVDFNELLEVQLKNDNVQGFGTKCDRGFLLSRINIPDEDILVNCFKNSSSTQRK